MTVSLVLHNGVVHIPTSYAIQRGFYYEAAPIASVPVEQTQKLTKAILIAIERGNPPISRDEVSILMKSKKLPMLMATRTRSWNALEQQMKGSWSIKNRDGVYKIQVNQPLKPRGWHEDPEKSLQFSPGASVEDVIARAVAMIQECARE